MQLQMKFSSILMFLAAVTVASATTIPEMRSELTCGALEDAVPLLRAYSAIHTDHFYTTNSVEMQAAINSLEWKGEGITAFIFPFQAESTIPLYRMFSPSASDHFYTINSTEKTNAVTNLRYVDEGIVAYIYPNQICGSIPLYRAYTPGALDHFYTTSLQEKNNAVANLGYADGWLRSACGLNLNDLLHF